MPQQTTLAPFTAIETPGDNPPLAFGAESNIDGERKLILQQLRRFAPKES